MRSLLGHTFTLILSFVLFWNSGFIGAEYGLPYTGPYSLLFWRYTALSLILLVVLLLRRKSIWPGAKPAGFAAIVGLLAHGVWLGCVIISLERGVPAGIVALVVALQPMTTGALSGWATGERTSIMQWVGLLIGFSGVLLVVGTRMKLGGVDTPGAFGYLIPFGSVAAITVASLLQRRMELKSRHYLLPLDQALFYQSLGTILLVALPAFFVEQLATEWTMPFITAMLWLIIVVSLGAYALMWKLLSRMDATRVAGLFYLGPPVTMVMGWLAFGDTLQPMDIVGLMIVAFGVLLVQTPAGMMRRLLRLSGS